MKCDQCGGTLPRVGPCKLCEMFAARRPPRGVSDDTRFAGFTKVGGAQFGNPQVRDYYLAEAKAAGVDVTGKQYVPQIAAFPGDPRAWVDSQGDMRRVLEERGWSSDGDLKVKGREVERAADEPLAEDLVEDLVEDRLYERHGPLDEATISVKEFNEVKAAVIADHSLPAHLRD